ncbi:MAG: response regulator [Cyanobacteria bacterium P01_D01_bin.1]
MPTIQTATVLIVEDVASERELMSHYLRQEGCSVIGAMTGVEGLDRAVALKPDVIVTDIVMPGISGFELCRKLKRLPETQATPVIMCSSKGQTIDRMWGKRQGADAYLTKPYTKDQLIEAIKTVLI